MTPTIDTITLEQQWLQTCESFAQATPREWSANDERLYRSGLTLIAAVRAEERAVITRKEREQIERLADCRAECERLEAALERSPQADGTGQP